MLKGFKEFITQGNVLDLAVAVIIAGAFTPVVNAATAIIMAIIAGLVGQPNFDSVWAFHVGSSEVQPGLIITALINFLLVAAAVYFVIVVPVNKAKEMAAKKEEEAAPEITEAELLTEIRDLLAKQN